jgi:hypothetical protein
LLKDESIEDKFRQIILKANTTGEKGGLRKYCIEIAQDLTISNSVAFIENIALVFYSEVSSG